MNGTKVNWVTVASLYARSVIVEVSSNLMCIKVTRLIPNFSALRSVIGRKCHFCSQLEGTCQSPLEGGPLAEKGEPMSGADVDQWERGVRFEADQTDGKTSASRRVDAVPGLENAVSRVVRCLRRAC
jgi:hypothetical protein